MMTMQAHTDNLFALQLTGERAGQFALPSGGNQAVVVLYCAETPNLQEALDAVFTVEGSVRVTKVAPCQHLLVADLERMEYAELVENCACLVEDAVNELTLPFYVGIGGIFADIAHIDASLAQAKAALLSLMASGLKFGVKEYRAQSLDGLAALLDGEMQEYLACLARIKGMEEFLTPEFERIFQIFISKNLNVSDTAREAYLHRNSLTYKLDKLARISGLDLRNFHDALVFKLLLEHRLL
jgi:carbohydrate diacid regulator